MSIEKTPPLEIILLDLWEALSPEFKSEPWGTKTVPSGDDQPLMATMISDLWEALKEENKS